jgi:hypothetical protein
MRNSGGHTARSPILAELDVRGLRVSVKCTTMSQENNSSIEHELQVFRICSVNVFKLVFFQLCRRNDPLFSLYVSQVSRRSDTSR